MNRRRGVVCLLLASLLVGLAIMEGGARLLGVSPRPEVLPETTELGFQAQWGETHDVYGWKNRPGSYETDYGLMTFREGGIRNTGADHSLASSDVIVVGGSNTQGYQADDDIVFASRLDQMFPEQRFLNHASGGWGTYQSYLVARDLLAADAEKSIELTIYGLYSDHRRRNIARNDWIYALEDSRGRNFVPPHVRSLWGHDLTHQNPAFINPWPGETRSSLVTLLHKAYLLVMHPPRSDTHMYQVMHSILKRLKTATDQHGSDFLVVFIDSPEPLLQGWLEASGIDAIVCLNPLWHRPEFKLEGKGYPNAKQHNFWANCIADNLEKRGWRRDKTVSQP